MWSMLPAHKKTQLPLQQHADSLELLVCIPDTLRESRTILIPKTTVDLDKAGYW